MPSSYFPSPGPPEPTANLHPNLPWSAPWIWRTLRILATWNRPERPSPLYPSSTLLQDDTISAPLPCCNERWWFGCHSRPSKVPAYHNGGTVGVLGLPPPIWPWFPLCICKTNVLLVSPSLPPAPYTPQLVIPSVPPWLVTISDTIKGI